MKIKSSELARKIGVTRATVSNWIHRDKKLVFNEDGEIDTENDLNKNFLCKKASFLYGNQPVNTEKEQKIPISTDSEGDNDNDEEIIYNETFLKNVNIDELGENEARKIKFSIFT